MEIISRQQAVDEQRSRYFTGVPCKRGHISERYTKCAVCVECLHPSFLSERDKRRKARALMEPKRFRIYPGDLELFQAAAHVIAAAREPKLQLSDVLTKRKPELYANLALHTLMVHPDDLPALRALESNLERNHQC